MSKDNKTNTGNRDNAGKETRHKGESQQTQHKGADSVSKQDAGRHRKDESHGAARNTTKKGGNSV